MIEHNFLVSSFYYEVLMVDMSQWTDLSAFNHLGSVIGVIHVNSCNLDDKFLTLITIEHELSITSAI